MFFFLLLYFTTLAYCGNGSCGFLRIMYSNCSMLILRSPLARPLLPLQHPEHADPQKLQIEQKNTITKCTYTVTIRDKVMQLLKKICNLDGMAADMDGPHERASKTGYIGVSYPLLLLFAPNVKRK